MFCAKCGTALQRDNRFCPTCGKSVKEGESEFIETGTNKLSPRKKAYIFVLVTAIVVIAVVSITLLIKQNASFSISHSISQVEPNRLRDSTDSTFNREQRGLITQRTVENPSYSIERVVPEVKANRIVFSDGMGLFEYNRKYGYIDETGKVVIEPKYEMADAFADGLALVARTRIAGTNFEEWSLIDREGNIQISFADNVQVVSRSNRIPGIAYLHVRTLSNNPNTVYLDSDYYTIDGGMLPSNLDVILDAAADSIVEIILSDYSTVKIHYFSNLNEAHIRHSIRDGWTTVSIVGRSLSNIILVEEPLDGGYVKQWIIDVVSGTTINESDETLSFLSSRDGTHFPTFDLYDARSGSLIVEWDESFYVGLQSDGLIPCRRFGRWGYIDYSGNFAIEAEYDDARHFSNGYAAVKSYNSWMLIDKNNRIVMNPLCSGELGTLRIFDNGIMHIETQDGSNHALYNLNEVINDGSNTLIYGAPSGSIIHYTGGNVFTVESPNSSEEALMFKLVQN